MSNQFTAGWTPEEDRIVRMFYGTRSFKSIAKTLPGRSRQAVKNRVKVLGIGNRAKRWSEEELDILRRNYENNPRITELIPRFKWEEIRRQANSMGLYVKYGHYDFNHGFFSKMTEKAAYVAGFIAADGYLNIKANRIEIAIQTADRIHLQRIADAMEYTGPLYEKTGVGAVSLHITSQKLLADIIAILGVTNNKTLALKQCEIHDGFINHFIRGYFDGDGSIKPDVKCIRILGTFDFLSWIAKYVADNLKVTDKVPKRKGLENVYELGYYGADMLTICAWMYNGSTLHLDRKYQRYVRLLSEHKVAKCHISSNEDKDIVDSTGNSGAL